MKNAAITLLLLIFWTSAFAQSGNDKRGFQGTVTSALKQTLKAGGKEDSNVKTEIEFTGRTITIEGETYEIVKKTFDGKNKTVFTCTKRRGTFEVTYTAGESISVIDTGNKEIETVYSSLTEK